MFFDSGRTTETRWFDFRASFTSPVTRVEWEYDATYVIIPVEVADTLIKNGHARLMTQAEVEEHNKTLELPKKEDVDPPPAKKPVKKGD